MEFNISSDQNNSSIFKTENEEKKESLRLIRSQELHCFHAHTDFSELKEDDVAIILFITFSCQNTVF